MRIIISIVVMLLLPGLAAAKEKKGKAKSDWNKREYGSQRTDKDIRTALASKGFAWLSGSPADNDKLSVGKNAQFFGFVALRYDSGRAAKRGDLGRAFYAISTPSQREAMAAAVNAEKAELAGWWTVREEILRKLEAHLYTGQAIDRDKMLSLGSEFGRLNGVVSLHEARAFASLEDSLTTTQLATIQKWRQNPESARTAGERIHVAGFNKADQAQLEDLYAKAFSWLTGEPTDNQIVPLGQPAQFFGFVSIRQKSGHAASRARIAKAFQEFLSLAQRSELQQAVGEHQKLYRQFSEERDRLLQQMNHLRVSPASFEPKEYDRIARRLGTLEIEVGILEAHTYRRIRATMNNEQLDAMMKLRGQYILDPETTQQLSTAERGRMLMTLCIGCHGMGTNVGPLAPSLRGLYGRPIAVQKDFEYSAALKRHEGDNWTAKNLDSFLASPRTFAPGTKMEFQGLLNATDRNALIQFLREEQK